MARFIAFVRDEGAAVRDYPTLYAWSVDQREAFWSAVWRFCGVVADDIPGHGPWYTVLVGRERVAPPTPELGPTWFLGARLNFAENLLRHDDDRSGSRRLGRIGTDRRADLPRTARGRGARGGGAPSRRHRGRATGWRRSCPTFRKRSIVMLAAASIGAVWSSCSPDFGVNGVLDRFGQIQPRVLLAAADTAMAASASTVCRACARSRRRIPGIERVVVVPLATIAPRTSRGSARRLWNEYVRAAEPAPTLEFARLPFDHPLYIMYSSGTTGLPKCMVHGAGGTLLQHLKEHALHVDIGRDDRVFYFTTCGWMMWNWLVSALAARRDGGAVRRRRHPPARAACCGTWPSRSASPCSARAPSSSRSPRRRGCAPARRTTSSALRAHPLHRQPARGAQLRLRVRAREAGRPAEQHQRRHRHHLLLRAGQSRSLPVWRGELQCRGLGMAVEVFDEHGRPAPVGRRANSSARRRSRACRWSSGTIPTAAKYHAAYFDVFPNVWRHGDWAARTAHDGLVIHGRSDATLNPRRRAHRYRRDLPAGGADGRGRGERRGRPGRDHRIRQRRARGAVRAAAEGARARRGAA